MEDERRRILEMVEQGRISAQEANELLAALEEPEGEPLAQAGECHWRSRCGRGDRRRVGETIGGVVGALMRALFGRLEARGRRRQR